MKLCKQQHWRTGELSSGVTAIELSRRLGRSIDAVRSAARRQGVALKPKHRGWPERKRTKVLELIAQGTSQTAAARAARVPESTARLWVRNSRQFERRAA